MILGAMVALDDSMEEIPSAMSPFSSKEERMQIRRKNIMTLTKKIDEYREDCENWKNNNEEYNTAPAFYSEVGKLMKKMTEYEDFDDVQDDIEDKLGKDIFVASDKGFLEGMISNKEWKGYLKCNLLRKTAQLNDEIMAHSENTANAGLRTVWTPGTANSSDNQQFDKEVCESMTKLKECIQNFYDTSKELSTSGRFSDKDEFDDIQEKMNDAKLYKQSDK